MTSVMADSTNQATRLDHGLLLALLDSQLESVERRFPDRGLVGVSRQVRETVARAPELCARILRPNLLIRFGVFLLGLAILTVLVLGMSQLEFRLIDGWAALEAFEAAISTSVYLGIAMFFLVSLERRWRRERVLEALQELRALSHVLDMHQMNKDPERLIFTDEESKYDDRPAMTPFLLERYLDYTADLLSMIGKLAAWYAQQINDAGVLIAVNEIEQLTGDLSRKIWQKIQIVNQAHQQQ
ncbi:MAG: hypothetical protein QGG40_20055 [Myxococcota bacterium]|jgi:hypothetical protein|nr:hypothetical protein [Myxococcota bacterium]